MNRFAKCFASLGVALTCALAGTACDDGNGTVEVRVWGEGNLENGVPAADVKDGWKVDFTKFDVTFADMQVAGQPVTLNPTMLNATTKSVSEEMGQRGQVIGSLEVAPGLYNAAQFTLVQTVVEGSAEKAGTRVNFSWVFPTPVSYTACEAVTRVKSEMASVFEITLHADHYLYDSLAAHSTPPGLVFGPIAAADMNKDGQITQAELQATPIADFFDTGSQKVTNMWEWLVAQNLTIAHTDGEHHCKGAAAPVMPGTPATPATPATL